MSPENAFRIDLALGYLAAILFALNYLWPKLKSMDRVAAFKLVATIHSFRYEGLAFLLTGFVGAEIPKGFAVPAAFGDLATSLLAIAALLTQKSPKVFYPLVWIFNIVGILDLLTNTVNAIRFDVPSVAGQLGAAYAIVMVYVPLLVVSHVAAFMLLFQGVRVAAREVSRQATT